MSEGAEDAIQSHHDPTGDPAACSRCGVYIGPRGGDYCDPCAREFGAKPPLRRCLGCRREFPQEMMEAVDLSGPEKYYPEFEYLCRGCSGGDE